MGFYVVGSNTTIHNNNKPLRLSPCLELKNTLSSVYPGNETAWILTRPRVYPADLLYPAASGGESVIRLSLGKLLVNLCKWSNGLLIIPHPLLFSQQLAEGDARVPVL